MTGSNTAPSRSFTRYALPVDDTIKQQMLNWGNQFNICCFMDNHGYQAGAHSYECLLAAGSWRWVKLRAGSGLDLLQAFAARAGDWLFGHLGFGLQQDCVGVSNRFDDAVGFPDGYFFVPEHLLLLTAGELSISSYSLPPDQVLRQVMASRGAGPRQTEAPTFAATYPRDEYIRLVKALQAHIQRGDCYEINFCQAFTAQGVQMDPVQVYRDLCRLSPTPFSVYYKLDDSYCLCASPERYFRLANRRVWSEPIKGTAARDPDPAIDQALATRLRNDPKEQAENVMIVDLVRNDLSRVCQPGSVQVEELFGVYPFPRVHQMISTVTGLLKAGLGWTDVVAASFPMGSMTGAPKKRVLELIGQYERRGRGLFSGSIGYVDPGGHADFNVVIRSLQYHRATGYLEYLVGSGITGYADAAHEYEECLLKAAAIRSVWASAAQS